MLLELTLPLLLALGDVARCAGAFPLGDCTAPLLSDALTTRCGLSLLPRLTFGRYTFNSLFLISVLPGLIPLRTP